MPDVSEPTHDAEERQLRRKLEGLERRAVIEDTYPSNRPDSMIFRALEATSKAADDLHTLLNQLTEELGPVLGPARPRPEGEPDEDVAEERSPLTHAIERVGNHLHQMSGQVRDLLAQLEV